MRQMPFFSTIRIEEEIRAQGNSLQNLHVHNRIGAGGREGTGPLLPSIAGKKKFLRSGKNENFMEMAP